MGTTATWVGVGPYGMHLYWVSALLLVLEVQPSLGASGVKSFGLFVVAVVMSASYVNHRCYILQQYSICFIEATHSQIVCLPLHVTALLVQRQLSKYTLQINNIIYNIQNKQTWMRTSLNVSHEGISILNTSASLAADLFNVSKQQPSTSTHFYQ